MARHCYRRCDCRRRAGPRAEKTDPRAPHPRLAGIKLIGVRMIYSAPPSTEGRSLAPRSWHSCRASCVDCHRVACDSLATSAALTSMPTAYNWTTPGSLGGVMTEIVLMGRGVLSVKALGWCSRTTGGRLSHGVSDANFAATVATLTGKPQVGDNA
jgi:hypothetical protein